MNINKKVTWLLIGLVLASFVLAACSGGSSASNFPTGKFTLPDNQFEGYTFTEDGAWTYFFAGTTEAEGKFKVKGDQWIEQGTDECPFPGTYQWTFDGTNLSFKVVGEDKCDPRRTSTDGKTFVLAK